ncbi:hypothetical protein PR202_ga21351 [Eleusine coracana subsp. coracana]|uniref:Uncharacterized protein n=1 Tax=Eleusine coracana subsp. coracana TaxID=191504 RepID=A0AAV5D156_ELECO|nr:hypothetical protein PR202_ga21351 [Eleusine coracana subsp. coracana]
MGKLIQATTHCLCPWLQRVCPLSIFSFSSTNISSAVPVPEVEHSRHSDLVQKQVTGALAQAEADAEAPAPRARRLVDLDVLVDLQGNTL